MRVLLLTPMVPQAEGKGAIPLLLHAELEGLRERHELTVVTAVGDEPGEEEAAIELNAAGVDLHLADRRRPPAGLRRWQRRLRLAGTWGRGRWPWRTVWFAAPGIQRILDRLTAERGFDVVAVEDSAMSVFRLPPGVATTFTHHEVLRPRAIDWHPGPPSRWPRWLLGEIDWRRWEGFQREAWRRFDRVQVFSRRDADMISALAPEVAPRVRVNPFGLAVPPRTDPSREVPGLLLFLGNFAHPPNRDAAIWLAREIMPAVLVRNPNARLRIVGAAPPAEVLALAGPSVELVANADSVQPHLRSAAVVLSPVRTGGGMRMKVLQALAAGKPIVTTSRGAEGYRDLGESPPLVIAEEAQEIATAATALLADEAGRRVLGERARSFAVRHHSPEAWAERLTAVYEEARRERGARGR